MEYTVPNARCSIVAALLLGIASVSHAQPATLSGFVTDQSNGQPLELVNIVLRSADGEVRGGSTNRDGLYLIARITPGRYEVEVSYIGYVAYLDTLDLGPNETRTFNVALRPSEEELDEVLVATERTGGAARVTAGQQIIRPADIEHIPGPDVSGDLAAYLTAQPGIVTSGDRGGQLFIRGGEPTQNLVQLDGILLYQPFHILGFYSAFPADIINRADVYAGGYGSRFGGRISSVIDVGSRPGNFRQIAGAASVSPFLSSVLLEGPIIRDRMSIIASVRQSNLEQGAARYIDDPMPFNFGDAFAKFQTVITENSRGSITALRTHDRGTLAEDTGGVPPEEIRWVNEAVGLRFLVLPQIVAVMADFHVSYSRLRTELGDPEAPSRTSSIENTHVGIDATYFGDRIDAEAGTSVRVSTLNSEIGGLFQNIELRFASITNWGNYLEFDIDVGKGLRVRPGLRAQFYKVRFNPFWEPRLRIVWESGLQQVSGALGLYHQEIIGLNDRRDAASVFTVWTNIPQTNPNIPDVRQGRIQRAVHAILGYRVSPARWVDISVEGFYKDLSNLFIPEFTSLPQLTTRLQTASGRVAGADIRLELRREPFYGFVNYGLSSTRYTPETERLRSWFTDGSPTFRPPHDRRHQMNVVGGTTVAGFDLSVRWEFGSGLPFSRAIGFDGFALIDDVEKASEVAGTRRVIYERPYNAVLPTYHRLDVSVDRTFSLGRANVTIQGSLINTYDRRNLFYLDVFTLRRVDQLPLVPSVGLKVDFI
ncbi:MAG TPA: TonB-dependent receptor [Rhodothermales bacterium]|nr:TonB-dependent receptor [Rhodothermales bacterium]